MRIKLLPSSFSQRPEDTNQYLTSYIIDGVVAIDAGSLGWAGSLAEQAMIRDVLISHSHLDHVASLPIFVDNVYEANSDCVSVHGGEAALESLRRDIFNGRVWADFVGMTPNQGSFLKLALLRDGAAIEVGGLRITPVEVNHTAPTHGFVVESESSAVVIASDTGPTEKIWDLANRTPNVKAVFIEASFPDALAPIANASKHLTPSMLAAEIAKLSRRTRIIAVHLKPRFRAQIEAELRGLGRPEIEIVRPGAVYEF